MAAGPYDMLNGDMDGAEAAPVPEAKPRASTRRNDSVYTREMRRANIVLAALFLVGGGAVYFLSLRKGPATASAQQKVVESEIDSAILRLSQKAPTSPDKRLGGALTRDLAETFYTEIRQRQVPLDELAKDPFVFVEPPQARKAEIGLKTVSVVPQPETKTPEQQTRERMMKALAGLHLQSVMMGDHGGGTALISNNLLAVGQDIEGFTIKSVEPKAVVLTWNNEEFVLTMP